ncbi:hypothetical protein U3516DRAFT_781627 [Neocallimastix sp. 'constans']
MKRNSNNRQSFINPKMENTTNNVLICNEKKNGDFIETLNNKCGVIFENTFYKIEMYHIANNTIKTHYSALNIFALNITENLILRHLAMTSTKDTTVDEICLWNFDTIRVLGLHYRKRTISLSHPKIIQGEKGAKP